MTSITHSISSYLRTLSFETAQIAQRLDGVGWCCISAVVLVAGWFFLKGNKVRST